MEKPFCFLLKTYRSRQSFLYQAPGICMLFKKLQAFIYNIFGQYRIGVKVQYKFTFGYGKSGYWLLQNPC